jgi:hypothetical protein
MNKTPHVETGEPPAPLPYNIGRAFFMGSRMKNAEKLTALLEDSIEIMDKLSEHGWAVEGQRVVGVAGLKAARAWAQYFNETEFSAHMRVSVKDVPPPPKRDQGWGRKPAAKPTEVELLLVETETAEHLYKCVNLLSKMMRTLSRTVAGAAPQACTREGYTWYPPSTSVLMRAYGIPCTVRGNFVYANIANKETEFRRRQDLLKKGKAIHAGLLGIKQFSHLPSYFSSEQLPVYDS